jgi:hypothetical protein
MASLNSLGYFFDLKCLEEQVLRQLLNRRAKRIATLNSLSAGPDVVTRGLSPR